LRERSFGAFQTNEHDRARLHCGSERLAPQLLRDERRRDGLSDLARSPLNLDD
jgi:hypothetical protein